MSPRTRESLCRAGLTWAWPLRNTLLQVDVAVVEAGLGAARDATNVFDPGNLLAGVITPVGRDHMAALGGSLEAIAAAKAGVMKAGRPVVLAQQPEGAPVLDVLQSAGEAGVERGSGPAAAATRRDVVR